MATAPRTRQRPFGSEGFWFALPHLLLFTLFLLVPVVYGFYLSLHRWNILSAVHPFVGFSNYAAALSDDLFWLALRNTLVFVVLTVPLGNVVSLSLALGVSQVKRGTALYRGAIYLPTVISLSVVAVLWRWLYNRDAGLINLSLKGVVNALRGAGLTFLPAFEPFPWLADPAWVLPAIAVMTVWWTAGGNLILYLAGLNDISDEYHEAAKIDGASDWQRLWHVTLPLLRPTMLFCLVISVLGSFQIFGQSYVLFAPGSGPARSGLTLALYMYQQGFNQYEMGYGAAIAYLLFAVVLLLTLGQFRLFQAERASREERPAA